MALENKQCCAWFRHGTQAACRAKTLNECGRGTSFGWKERVKGPSGRRVWKLGWFYSLLSDPFSGCCEHFEQVYCTSMMIFVNETEMWQYVTIYVGLLVIFTTAFLTADTTQVYEINNCVTCAITCYSILRRPPNYCCSHTSSRNKSLVTVRYIGWSIRTLSGLLYTSYIYSRFRSKCIQITKGIIAPCIAKLNEPKFLDLWRCWHLSFRRKSKSLRAPIGHTINSKRLMFFPYCRWSPRMRCV